MRKLIAVIACTVLLVCGCRAAGMTAPAQASPAELRKAPTRVVLAGRALSLRTSLWRDFQPIAPPDGRPLIALLQIVTEDGSLVPEAVRAEKIWVIFGTEVWSAAATEERPRADTAPMYEVVAREGPKWGPQVTVDVVVQLRDDTGRSVLLRAPDQTISATH